MTSKLLGLPVLLAALFASAFSLAAADSNNQTITLGNEVQIPGGSLKAGTYNFSLEDRLSDRAVVRIINAQNAAEHYLLLAVPNEKLTVTDSNQLSFFKAGSDSKQPLKAWKCPYCSAPLEFVYPKLEAVKVTDDSTEPVLAVDPSYDKLPSNLSADDMKVVTLWLLSPERITADNVGQGVKAAKYSPSENLAAQNAPPAAPSNAQATADTATSASAPANEQASNATPRERKHLPKTASNTYLLLLIGLVCLLGAPAIRIWRRQRLS